MVPRFLFVLAVQLAAFTVVWIGRGPTHQSLRDPRFALVVLATVFVTLLFAMRRIGTPLGEIVEASERVADGDYSARVGERGSPWVRTMARAFNTMTSRLERQHQQRRELMADIAHELRTPLAVMQGRLEGMLDGVYPRDEGHVAQVLDETRTLARLVEDLRTLAHSESGTLSLHREPTDLRRLIADAIAAYQPQAVAAGVQVDSRCDEDLPAVDVDPVRIREVVSNLLSNAIRHAPSGGAVSVAVARHDRQIEIVARDDGPGISPEARSHIFDRFYKGSDSTGSGLGLTIARNLVVAHGGSIRADSAPGRGTTITVAIPGS
jgi:two-component system OmpR family sensor kinase/two-component system sensor histidine kinase BaeS